MFSWFGNAPRVSFLATNELARAVIEKKPFASNLARTGLMWQFFPKVQEKNIHQATTDDEFCSKKPLVLLSTNYRTLGTDLLLLKVHIPSSVPPGMREGSERAAAPGHLLAAQALRTAKLH